MTSASGLAEAVKKYIEMMDPLTPRAGKEQAFDDVFKLISCHERPTQPVQVENTECPGNESLSLHLPRLPPELHLKIVSYLDWHTTISLRLVSRYWREIITPHGVNWRTSLLINKLRCQELNRCLELRLDELMVRPHWDWAARYPCYTCMRWLHNHNFLLMGDLTSGHYRRRYVFLSNRWPAYKPPGSYWHIDYTFPTPAIRIPYDNKEKYPIGP